MFFFSNKIAKAPPHILDAIKFNSELSKQLHDARNEIDVSQPQPILSRDNWMLLAEIRPNDEDEEVDHVEIIIDSAYNWLQHRKKYSANELSTMKNWVEHQKNTNNCVNDNELPAVQPSSLNTMQKFAYNLIDQYNNQKKQLLLVINGTAGNIIYSNKSNTLFS